MNRYRHIDALQLARECIELGARMSTVELISGIGQGQLKRLFFAHGEMPPCGRRPNAPDWLFERAKVEGAAEASLVAVIFEELHHAGTTYTCALVAAYRLYRARCVSTPLVSFDRAFDVICCLYGLWTSRTVELQLHRCSACGSRYLGSMNSSSVKAAKCPFCVLLRRHTHERHQAEAPIN